MKNIIKDACILFAITLVAGILLGLVYNVTKDPIAQQNEKAKQKAYQEVIADADKFEALDGSYASDKVAETAKAVLSASATDFSKDDVSEVVAGIKNGKIIGFVETAGLGMRAKQDPSFLAQFNGTKTSEYKVVTDGTGSSSDSSIDAIGGSTVTSKAITKGVNAALAVYADLAKANVKTVGGVSVE